MAKKTNKSNKKRIKHDELLTKTNVYPFQSRFSTPVIFKSEIQTLLNNLQTKTDFAFYTLF
jgi:hypothetical protein